MECIENAVQKVMDEGKDRRQGFGKNQFGADGRGKNPYKKSKYKDWQKFTDDEAEGLENVSESRRPRRKK